MGAFAGAVGAGNEQRGGAIGAVIGVPDSDSVVGVKASGAKAAAAAVTAPASAPLPPPAPPLPPLPSMSEAPEEEAAKKIPESAINSFQTWWENQIEKDFEGDF